jgi:hypothetical protein
VPKEVNTNAVVCAQQILIDYGDRERKFRTLKKDETSEETYLMMFYKFKVQGTSTSPCKLGKVPVSIKIR